MEPGRVLITGATGFVGQHLVPFLTKRGWPLTLATRSPRNAMSAAAADVRVVQIGEVGPDTDWTDALDEVWAVVNLAGRAHVMRETTPDPGALFNRVNADGAKRLYGAAAAAGVRGFVQISSIGVLGDVSAPGRPFNDASTPHPHSPYACSKHAAEETLTAMATEGGPALVILRLPLLCGAGAKGNLWRLLRLSRRPIPLPLGGVRNRRSLLSVDNLASAIDAVLQRRRRGAVSGTFVLADRQVVSTGDIVAALREGFGMRSMLFPVPGPLLGPALKAAGGTRLATQLLGDLEIDASGFSAAFGWTPQMTTRACLVETARQEKLQGDEG
ncbi:MAG: NAD-dependent epimerase/dehydratase family protein [Hyphomicrobiaceae bacterium]